MSSIFYDLPIQADGLKIKCNIKSNVKTESGNPAECLTKFFFI